METVNCPLCGGAEWNPVVEAADFDTPARPTFRVVRCRSCELCITNPRPSAEEIGKYYAVDYLPHQIAAGNAQSNTSDVSPPRCAPRRPFFLRNYEKGHFAPIGQMRLMDFGCGGGSFLLKMRECGWKVTGVDFSEATVQKLRAELGLNVLFGTLPHPDLAPGSFDLITLWHSLEHVHQPLETLREVHRLLSPGGQVLVAVPNIESVSFEWFGGDWFGLDVPRHLTHFSPATLQKMLEKAGFRVKIRQHIRHSLWFRNSTDRARDNGHLQWPQSWIQSKFASSTITRCQKWLGRAESFLMIAERVESDKL